MAVRNLVRARRRSALVVAALAVPFALLTVLQTAVDWMDRLLERSATHVRVVVFHEMGLLFDLPDRYAAELAGLPGVRAVCPADGFAGTFGARREVLAATAIDLETFPQVWKEFRLDHGSAARFAKEHRGCVMERRLAARLGLRAGDAFTIKGTTTPIDLDLVFCGELQDWPDAGGMFLHRRYFAEAAGRQGWCTDFWMLLATAADVPAASRAAEARFANSAFRVRVAEEKSFIGMFVSMGGNVRALVTGLGLLIVGLIMVVGSNSVAIAVRERTGEVALMKALGFPARTILALIALESALLGLAAGLAGAGAGCLLAATPAARNLLGDFASMLDTPGLAALRWAAFSPLLGAAAGLVPAWLASRLRVVDGLRRMS